MRNINKRVELLATAISLSLTLFGNAFAQSTFIDSVVGVNNYSNSGPHTLLGAHATGPISANGELMIFDSATVPPDGAVTPKGCFTIPATQSPSTTSTGAMANVPNGVPLANGIVLVASSGTNCGQLTKLSNFFFSVTYQ